MMKRVVIAPIKSNTNKYIEIVINQLKNNGFEIFTFQYLFSSISAFKSIDIVHLNWYEGVKSNKDFISKVVRLLVIYFSGKSIVWTMHNAMPHENKNIRKQKFLLYLLKRLSKKIVIHSKISKEIILNEFPSYHKKIVYVPHPNYIDVYGVREVKTKSTTSNTLVLLYIGMVRPYKNIEMLIDIVKEFNAQLFLTIAGSIKNKEYADLIIRRTEENANIKLDLRFIPNNELIKYINETDLVILPYDLRSSLNSGTAILSFSYGRSVICPLIGTIDDLDDKSNVLSYTYNNEIEHKKQLKIKIAKAIKMKKADSGLFKKWGDNLVNQMNKNNDNEFVGNIIANLYRSI